jgi:hypothetical protein
MGPELFGSRCGAAPEGNAPHLEDNALAGGAVVAAGVRQPPAYLTSTQVARTSPFARDSVLPGKMMPPSLTTTAVSSVRKRMSAGWSVARDPLSGPANPAAIVVRISSRSFL